MKPPVRPIVELRILSGPSLGAAIELAAGVYVMGADDACDLILAADTSVADRHLELRVREQEGGLFPEVLARPLEGAMVVNGVEAPETGVSLPPGEALGLGFTALAWRPVGASWGVITLAPLEFAGHVPAGKTTETPETKPEPRVKTPEEPVTAAEDAKAIPSAAPATEAMPSPSSRARLLRAGGITTVLLAILFVFIVAILAGRSPLLEAAAQDLRAALDAAGFREIQIKTLPAALALHGGVADDQELRQVFRLTKGLPFRVHVENLRVGSDTLRFTRETFQTHGFFPEVRYLEAGGDLALALYLKDSMVETGMMASLSPDLPKLRTATRKVVYARDVAPVLEAELSRIGLPGERAVYLAGKVVLPFHLDIEARQKLDAALDAARKTLGVPVFFQVTETAPGKLPGERTIRTSAMENVPEANGFFGDGINVASGADELGGLKVMSVTLGEIPFVTMDDAQKFFPGAVLPGGATLVSIHADRLILQAGETTLTYPLKEEP
ncbi:MAG: type III secretion system inner membrane ring subunit SctD [Zoogloeaceae bacterium]|jgi:type III secretion protein D|nr:type III secretion system inner membrane ring subunit SctD [Zoogloeaceae bacterium]